MPHIVAVQIVVHDPASRKDGHVLTDAGPLPAHQRAEEILDQGQHDDPQRRRQREIAQVRTERFQRREGFHDPTDGGFLHNHLRSGHAHGHEGHGQDGKHFKDGKDEHQEKKGVNAETQGRGQNPHDAGDVIDEQFLAQAHARLLGRA